MLCALDPLHTEGSAAVWSSQGLVHVYAACVYFGSTANTSPSTRPLPSFSPSRCVVVLRREVSWASHDLLEVGLVRLWTPFLV